MDPVTSLLASVVVPTFRGRAVLEECLQGLRAQTMADFEVIVVDDGSEDGTVEWLSGSFPEVRVLALPRNQGFCIAVNHGIGVASAEVIALLNDDTIPDPDWLRALVAPLSDPAIGFCASRMVRYDDPRVLDGAGDTYSRHGLGFRVGRGEPDTGSYGPRTVLWASGGASAYRAKLLREIGGMDERFSAYYEDVDLGLRARAAGSLGRYVPESLVRHRGSWSDQGRRSTELTTRNSLLVIAKHWPASLILQNLPWLAYGHARNGLWAIRSGQGRAWLRGVRGAVSLWGTARGSVDERTAPWRGELARAHPFGR